MVEKIPDETIQKLRERMKAGVDAPQVAQELGINVTTVYNYTKDLPRKHTCIPLEQRNEIWNKVHNGLLKRDAAKTYNRSLSTIQTLTKDIPGYFGYKRALGTEELQLLRRLLTFGYLISEFYLYAARNLKLQVPMIRSIRIHGKTIFYLTGKEKETIEAYIRNSKPHLIQYRDIDEICKMMGVTLLEKEQEEFVQQIKRKNTIQLKIEDCGLEFRF